MRLPSTLRILSASCFLLPAARTESYTAGIDLQRQCTSRMPSFDCADSERRAVDVRIPLRASPISHDARIRTAGVAAVPGASSHAQMLRLERLSVTAPAAADAGGEGDAAAARPPQPLLSARTQQVQMQMHSFGSHICDPLPPLFPVRGDVTEIWHCPAESPAECNTEENAIQTVHDSAVCFLHARFRTMSGTWLRLAARDADMFLLPRVL